MKPKCKNSVQTKSSERHRILNNESSSSSSAVFFNLGSANSFLGSLKMLKIELCGTFRFRQVIRNFQEVPRIEKGWKTLL